MGASEGQAEPVAWQWQDEVTQRWHTQEHKPNYADGTAIRPLYTHPSAEIAALRERIAGMEKDAGRGSVAALQSARHAVYTASTLDEAFTSVQKLIDAAIAKEKQG
ncbi:hypothetical protein AWB80_03114 [Caballeronia pedi]|uniref:Uncharacterized protein n=1 Tax=Caballeronia pedi TaxID=1777141 RepID=A0A158B720_9BURK|nr:hypothetical protein [Caballeronia pedi]SAK65884.1 hypothetical protein AWB80_03114 [Caballeronia pedi]